MGIVQEHRQVQPDGKVMVCLAVPGMSDLYCYQEGDKAGEQNAKRTLGRDMRELTSRKPWVPPGGG